MRAVSVHLENNCGSVARLKQMCEVLSTAATSDAPTIIAGDFNTLQQGVARLLPATFDQMSFVTLGRSEQDLWREFVAPTKAILRPLERAKLDAALGGADAAILRQRLALFADVVERPTTTMSAWLFEAKLDWLLSSTKHFRAASTRIGNAGGSMSDHKSLIYDLNVL